jgi:hypothetical protein
MSASLNAVVIGLMSLLANCFKSFNIGAAIGPRTKDETPFTFEGPAFIIKRAQASLIDNLNKNYPGVQPTFSERTSTKDDRLTKIIINETSSGLKRSISTPSSSIGKANGKKFKMDLGLGEEALMSLNSNSKDPESDIFQKILQELKLINESYKLISESYKQQSLINLEILKALQKLNEK